MSEGLQIGGISLLAFIWYVIFRIYHSAKIKIGGVLFVKANSLIIIAVFLTIAWIIALALF